MTTDAVAHNSMNPKGIYLHVPFCAKKCAYCDFYSRGASPALVEEYVFALTEQIRLSKTDTNPVGSIYFGGGTPSMLTEKQLGRIFSALEKYNLTPDAEITIECNPEDLTQDFAKSVKGIGFNRISLGVQSFDKNELISISRTHTPEIAENSMIIAKNHFDNVSVDLMLGTPSQSEDSLEASLSKCKALQPNHISAYLMKVYENTVFGKKGVTEASEELSERLYLKTSNFFKEIGYEHYEISSFSLDGKYSRHNMLYWTGGEYAAFGAGACGYENGIRYRYPGNAEEFAKKHGQIEKIIEEEETASSLKEENLIFGLRTSKGILFDVLTEDSVEYVSLLCKNGFAETSNDIFRLTPKGWLISNEIITELLIRECE